MKVSLCNNVSSFSGRQNSIGKKLFDEVCVVSLQKLHQLSVHMLINVPKNLIHFTLLISNFLQKWIELNIIFQQSWFDNSKISMPILFGYLLSSSERWMRLLTWCWRSFTLPRSSRSLLLKFRWFLSQYLIIGCWLRSSRIRSIECSSLIVVQFLFEWTHYLTTRVLYSFAWLSSLYLCLVF